MKNLLERRKNVLGGALVIKGTRVPITRILCLIERGRSVDYIVKTHYPFLSADQVQAALKEASKRPDSRKNAR